MEKAFFLDRDGTINEDCGYLHDVEKLRLLPGAAEAIRMMNQAAYKVIVVTNQSGVARGYFSFYTIEIIHDKLQKLLQDKGAKIDAFYICPHYAKGIVEPYNISCNCRKPKLGLYNQAIKEHDIDMTQSYAVGDRLTDIQNLHQLGIKRTALLGENNPPYCYSSLLAFTRSVLGI